MKRISCITWVPICILLCVWSKRTFSQQENREKTEVASANLFLHTDKSIYVNNEYIWFTGYVLNVNLENYLLFNTLYVVLTDGLKKEVVRSERFLINRGLAKGALFLPDSLEAGEYSLIAYTNDAFGRDNFPVFRQWISIRSPKPAPFSVLRLRDDSLALVYKIIAQDGGVAAGAKVRYRFYCDGSKIVEDSTRVNSIGEAVITEIPKSRDCRSQIELFMEVSRNDVDKSFVLPYAVSKKRLSDELTVAKEPTVKVHLISDSAVYGNRSLTKWKVKITDTSDRPLSALFSISCVLTKRISNRLPDIASYYYAQRISGRTTSAINSKKGDTLFVKHAFDGAVEMEHKSIKRPVSLVAIAKDGHSSSFETDSSGRFALQGNMVGGPAESFVIVSVSKEKDQFKYRLHLKDRNEKYANLLAQNYYPYSRMDREEPITHEEKQYAAGILAPVVVKSRSRDEYVMPTILAQPGCEEVFVCSCGHWDCTKCPPALKPVEGHLYYDLKRRQAFYYKPCNKIDVKPFMAQIRATNKPIDFHVRDYHNQEYPDKELYSTIYWNYGIQTDSAGEASFSFFTNDLPGEFTCVIQGVSAGGPVDAVSKVLVRREEAAGANYVARKNGN